MNGSTGLYKRGVISIRTVTAVTGYEEPIDTRDPLGALREFYRAFNVRDIDLMECNWVTSEDASLANPLGGIRRGWNDIRDFYERTFQGPPAVTLELHDYSIHRCGEFFYAVGREHGVLWDHNRSLELKFRTSRIFRFTGERWRQVHHHGSIDNPELLLRYQAAIH